MRLPRWLLAVLERWFGTGDWNPRRAHRSAPGYRFDPDYRGCADSECGELWRRVDGPHCPACGGPDMEMT